jgi:hypothetical protein
VAAVAAVHTRARPADRLSTRQQALLPPQPALPQVAFLTQLFPRMPWWLPCYSPRDFLPISTRDRFTVTCWQSRRALLLLLLLLVIMSLVQL